jgi:hypothetical protein
MRATAIEIACIVEGHGDATALPILIRRIVGVHDPSTIVFIHHPIRIPKTQLVNRPQELERTVDLAARKVANGGGVVVLLDADDDCPAELGPVLLNRARACRSDVPFAVVVAKREFESWFVAAAESLREQRGLAADLAAPPSPEDVHDPKGWLTARMEGARSYVATLDQPALATIFDLDMARRADSFDKFYREIVGLVRRVI